MRARSVLAVMLGVGFAVAGCDSKATRVHQNGAQNLRAVSAGLLTFTYPASWNTASYPMLVTSFSSELASLSTQPQHDPCFRAAGSVSCPTSSFPIAPLARNGVWVTWGDAHTAGGPGFDGQAVTIDGNPAVERIDRPGRCSAVRGDETWLVGILRGGWQSPDDVLVMSACLRGPDLRRGEAQVGAMLTSVSSG